MFFGEVGGIRSPPLTVWWYTTPSLPRIPPTYTDILTCFGGVNPFYQVYTPYPQKKFWKNFWKIWIFCSMFVVSNKRGFRKPNRVGVKIYFMKKLIISTLLMFFCVISYSQERVNRKKLMFDSTSSKITSSTGWSYNTTLGEWVDYQNLMCPEKSWKNFEGEKYLMSQFYQNFISIHTKTLDFNGTQYYAVLVEKWSGQYKYPSIKEDWYEYKIVVCYLFSTAEFLKLRDFIYSPTNGSVLELKTMNSVKVGNSYEEYDESVLLDLIQNELIREKTKYSSTYIFPIMKTKNNEIRFYLPQTTKYEFEKRYFETNITSFSNLINFK